MSFLIFLTRFYVFAFCEASVEATCLFFCGDMFVKRHEPVHEHVAQTCRSADCISTSRAFQGTPIASQSA